MEHVFLYLSCFDLVACSASCGQWLGILRHAFLWKQYSVGLGLPMPLLCYSALRHYAACLVVMEKCWLRYKVYVDRRREAPWHRPLCDITGVCDLSGLGGPPCLSRRCSAPVLRDALQDLCNYFGALPYDYVAALDTVWQPCKDFAVGDLILVQDGVPVIRDMCKNHCTGICAVTIGYICPNGCGGHRSGIDFDVYELVMSFRIGSPGHAVGVCYTGVCHDQIGMGMRGPFGLVNVATVVAAFPVTLKELAKVPTMSNTMAVHIFHSFAEVVSVCIDCIERPESRHGFFLPCFQYWMGIESNCDCAADDGVSSQIVAGTGRYR